MTGIVVVAHSEQLAAGVCEVARQMAGGEVPVLPAGGTDDGRLGTSFEKVRDALERILGLGHDALVLVDLGSAVMIAQMVVETLPPEWQGRVRLSNAPLVEGAIAAVVAAAGGGNLETVQRAAEQALSIPKIPELEVPPVPEAGPEEGLPEASVELVVPNPTGLHARPASLFVQTAMRFRSEITVQNVTHGRPPANAKSMMEVASRGTAWQGERIRIVARGEDAAEAIRTLRELVESGFGEMEEAAPIPPRMPEPTVPRPAESMAAGRLQGIPASPGIAMAPAFQYRPFTWEVERRTVSQVDAEISRLRSSLEQARRELEALQEEIAVRDPQTARIFEFQRMMLEDPLLVSALEERIRQHALSAEAAAEEIFGEWVHRFEGESEISQLRAADVRDVQGRLMRILMGAERPEPLREVTQPVVVIARELTPSDTARLDREKVKGICTVGGGTTSHVAILARMWGIPAVVGLGEEILTVPDGTMLAVDGEAGLVEVNPPPESIRRYEESRAQREVLTAVAFAHKDEPAITQDGHRVQVFANIGDVASAREAVEFGAEGVGLLRTEFLFVDRETMPDEEEQYAAYRAIADTLGSRPLIIRTLDIGGDKPLPYLRLPPEANPFLGVRAIRLSLSHPDLFLPQLRAILRAGVGRNVHVMFPMISTREEVLRALEALEQAKADLEQAGVPYARDIPVGIMVETPAAAIAADLLAPLVDFFSIGSNDLTQYVLACDRGNEQLRALYQPLDPAVLRLIGQVIDTAHRYGKLVGLCGELAGEPLAIPLLLGLGLDEFSMNPAAIPHAKWLIRRMSMAQAREVAQQALQFTSAAEVVQYLKGVLQSLQGKAEGASA
ncbi:MAG: phosphoenolpyruvate--protein phosphotransferase [Anaerolineae bacterium]|nr:phosphoenolpyruvate--protein phosphotransferase [Anaerolineae bacterium]MCX8067660.1 phosphoenolpyruvate--protein phosphotransferase [Anaerolineae bacterium]MDW7992405.1 phosphoenolpyruvate--protein phosphotransferase [Anaerolineae bacterium]